MSRFNTRYVKRQAADTDSKNAFSTGVLVGVAGLALLIAVIVLI